MQAIISALPIVSTISQMRNKLVPVTPMAMYTANITTLKLNKVPLPKQPVPELKQTAERYLRSVKPLLNDNEYANTEQIVKSFISSGGDGPMLQQKLIDKQQKTDNWMRDWWLETAYLGYRVPVIVHSSPGTVAPLFKVRGPDDVYTYAGRLVVAVCEYNKLVLSGNLEQEKVRDQPLDMQPYGMILGTHRRPAKKKDILLHTDYATHIIIISNNHFFKLDVISKCGIMHESKLIAAIKDVAQRSCAEGKPIGILTGNDRDTWAEDHDKLQNLGKNRNILQQIESSLFVLCLDKAVPQEILEKKNNSSVRALQTLTGVNSCVNAGNRWHDKTIQYIVSADGCMGMTYEHTPCEGVPIAVLHDYVVKSVSGKENVAKIDSSKDFPRATLLTFETNSDIDCAIEKATESVDKLSDDIDMECFLFDKFGTDEIKKLKTSPDSFIQIALQVTYYKLHGKPPAHYESAGLRRFINARTECIRSTSTESVAFAKIMVTQDAQIDKQEAKEAMLKAIKAHSDLAGQAVSGQGVDRHLYGLKMIAQTALKDLPDIYKDIAYKKSTYFTVTSSQVPYKTASFMCYGPVVQDGYGCCYNPRPKDIFIACASFKSYKGTSSQDFACTLQETFCRMKELGSC